MKVAFVYAGGRNLRGSEGPSDFFYGARELGKVPEWTVDCLDVDNNPADLLTGLIAGRFFKNLVPPRTTADWIARSRRMLPRLKEYDVVVSTSTELSFGLALWKELGLFKKPLVGILSGAVNYPIASAVRRGIAARLMRRMHVVLFADAEETEIRQRFNPHADRLQSGWFGVDETFWIVPEVAVPRVGILSVGNDGRRDYDTLVEAAMLFPEIPFTVVTRLDAPNDLPANIRWRRGDWKENALSDEQLRELYRTAACVVVPLKESIQPSGQSVAMQAMMCGAPVVITKTQGWWGSGVIRDGMEVALVSSGNAELLAAAIQKRISTSSELAGREALLGARWTAHGFAERLAVVIEHAARVGRKCESKDLEM
jgi:glycosyltransferase involved in cell wall biosynthesis